MNFVLLVDRTLMKMSLYVVRSAVSVVRPPGKLIRFSTTASLVQCVSAFCSHTLPTILPYVTVLPAGNISLRINKIVCFPDGILGPSPCVSRPI